jgi:transposase
MNYFLGIDVSKKKLDAALTIDGKTHVEFCFANTDEEISVFFGELHQKLSSLDNLTVCMEHTGIYCRPLLNYLDKNQLKVCLERSAQIKKSQGMVRGKNDRVDAQRIATYAYKNRESLRLWRPQRDVIERVKTLLKLRERLLKTKIELTVPIQESKSFLDPSIIKQMSLACLKSVKAIENDIENVEKMLDKLVQADSKLKSQHDLATPVVGIGNITALSMIVASGEFENIQQPKQFACYAGVAPFEYSSGTSIRGKTRVSKLANMKIKKLLHLAAMAAINYDPELTAYYQRKLSEGKNKMSVLNGIRNKLIARVYACIKHQRPYQKKHQTILINT